jgi:hypothetical protein
MFSLPSGLAFAVDHTPKRTLIEIIAGLAILATALIYGTDVFGAIVQRPAIAAVDDRALTRVMGHIHPASASQ